MKTPILSKIRELIETNPSFLLVTHLDPDGDGIGSCLALHQVLTNLGKQSRVWLPNGVPPRYRFLPRADVVVTESGPEKIIIAVDCDGLRRIGIPREVVDQAETLVDIDHHAGDGAFGDITWVDSTSPAAGFQVHALVRALGAEITPDIATCLYCAVGTDSGFFRYANTTPALLRVASELVEAGADPKAIAEATLDRYDVRVVKLAGRALNALEIHFDGRAALATLEAADFEAAGTDQTEGVIDYLRTIAGVDLLILMREAEDGWRVSMRSLAGADVSLAAKSLGGGGHAAAAGCTVSGVRSDAWDQVRAAVGEAIAADGQGR